MLQAPRGVSGRDGTERKRVPALPAWNCAWVDRRLRYLTGTKIMRRACVFLAESWPHPARPSILSKAKQWGNYQARNVVILWPCEPRAHMELKRGKISSGMWGACNNNHQSLWPSLFPLFIIYIYLNQICLYLQQQYHQYWHACLLVKKTSNSLLHSPVILRSFLFVALK